jgi:deazaflavin-dependent oxidoreductase (nitroreductase family)
VTGGAPGPFMRFLLRLPVWLYRARMGWVLDGRFLLLSHTGRTTGRARQTVLEVVDVDAQRATYFVASAWGDRADWFRNIGCTPEIRITVGRRAMRAVAEVLPPDESRDVLHEYRRRHRLAAAVLARLLGHSTFETVAETVPVVALRASRPRRRVQSAWR